jgi:Cof subfamily protein (haloacid dehalogenase superfamily)
MPDFSKFLIASDLDGTFLNKEVKSVPRNLDAIAHFQAHGGLFTVNTGRAHYTVRSSVPDTQCVVNAPGALCNGAYLYNYQTGEILLGELLPPEDVTDILEFCRTRFPDVGLRGILREKVLVHEPEGIEHSRVFGNEQGLVVFDLPVQDWPTTNWFKLVARSTPARIAEMRNAFAATFGERFGRTSSSARVVEIQLPHSNKAVGLEKMRLLSPEIASRTIIACGDFENDIPALKAADIAICPANAMEEVKKICDFVLCDCDDGLIADIIEHIEAGKILPKKK